MRPLVYFFQVSRGTSVKVLLKRQKQKQKLNFAVETEEQE